MNKKEPDKRILLRLPFEIWRQLKEIAKKEQRSLNAQVVFILTRWLENEFNDA